MSKRRKVLCNADAIATHGFFCCCYCFLELFRFHCTYDDMEFIEFLCSKHLVEYILFPPPPPPPPTTTHTHTPGASSKFVCRIVRCLRGRIKSSKSMAGSMSQSKLTELVLNSYRGFCSTIS